MQYVYAIVRGDHPDPALAGVGGRSAPVRLVRAGPLAAAASDVPADVELSEQDAFTHLDVLIGLLPGGPVLPLRMGTVLPDDETVRTELLEPEQDEFGARLDALDGRVEMHVDVDDDEGAVLRDIAAEIGPDASSGGTLADRLDLGRQVGDLVVDRRRALADDILAELRPIAVDDVPRALITSPEDPVLRWAFLIETKDIGLFDATVVRIRSKYPAAAVRHAGPLPASHFVDRLTTPQTPEPVDAFQAQGNWSW